MDNPADMISIQSWRRGSSASPATADWRWVLRGEDLLVNLAVAERARHAQRNGIEPFSLGERRKDIQ